MRPSTLRAAFVDLATELGEQGFQWLLLVHIHGSPLHIGALDDAGDFFHDTYGGTMVNLWGLMPVLGGWGGAMSIMTPAEKLPDGLSLHAGMDEHSLMLYLRPALVARDYRQAPPVAGPNYADATVKTAVEILDCKDARSYPRYVMYLETLPQYREWIDSSSVRDSVAGSRLDHWIMRRPR